MNQSEAAKDLAVWHARISLDTGSWSSEVLVENIKGVNVSGSEFWAINVLQKAGSLVKGGNIRAANVCASVFRGDTLVDPAFNFSHCHELVKSEVSLSTLGSNLFKIQTFSSESLVKGLTNENVRSNIVKIFENRKDDGEEAWWDERGQVVLRGINPTEKEVVITVGEAFSHFEEFNSSCFVELSSCFSAQGHVNNIEVGVAGPLNPLLERSLLDSSLRPVPSTL